MSSLLAEKTVFSSRFFIHNSMTLVNENVNVSYVFLPISTGNEGVYPFTGVIAYIMPPF
jgi:hypothetical protein